MKSFLKMYLVPLVVLACVFSSCTKDEVTSLSLSNQSMALKLGQSDSLNVIVGYSGDMSKQPVSVSVSDSKIASAQLAVSQDESKNTSSSFRKNIVVTALSTGNTTVNVQVGAKTITLSVAVTQTTLKISAVELTKFGPIFDAVDNNFMIMQLVPNTFTYNAVTQKYVGTGKVPIIYFLVPSNQGNLVAGDYIMDSSHEANTFIPGEYYQSNGETDIWGSYLLDVNETGVTSELITGGSYSVSTTGDNFVIEGDLITETKEVVHFNYSGTIKVTDKTQSPEDIAPVLTHGKLYYLGDAYGTGVSNNFIAQMATASEVFGDASLTGDVLQLELNGEKAVKDSLKTGTYNMISEISKTTMVAYTLVPGYVDDQGDYWGTWYYTSGANYKIISGNIILTRSGAGYNIIYTLYDRFGSKISGVYAASLEYINATSSSGVKAQKAKATRSVAAAPENESAMAKVKIPVSKVLNRFQHK